MKFKFNYFEPFIRKLRYISVCNNKGEGSIRIRSITFHVFVMESWQYFLCDIFCMCRAQSHAGKCRNHRLARWQPKLTPRQDGPPPKSKGNQRQLPPMRPRPPSRRPILKVSVRAKTSETNLVTLSKRIVIGETAVSNFLHRWYRCAEKQAVYLLMSTNLLSQLIFINVLSLC